MTSVKDYKLYADCNPPPKKKRKTKKKKRSKKKDEMAMESLNLTTINSNKLAK